MPKIQYVCSTCGKNHDDEAEAIGCESSHNFTCICLRCGLAFASIDAALLCEKSHPHVVRIASEIYEKERYPRHIVVEMDNGKKMKYCMERHAF